MKINLDLTHYETKDGKKDFKRCELLIFDEDFDIEKGETAISIFQGETLLYDFEVSIKDLEFFAKSLVEMIKICNQYDSK